MTPAARIKAINEFSKHSLSWYEEEDYKENDFDKVLKHINDFKHNISVLNEEVRMVQHQYIIPNNERDSLLEETERECFENSLTALILAASVILGIIIKQIVEPFHARCKGSLHSCPKIFDSLGLSDNLGKRAVEFFKGWKPLSPLQLAVEEVISK
ncbi:hypothetical protein Tco_1017180 [Tanacetum coccineum]|uniref:Uncharacterized protein n=1 Tax=Tanacetum coccineum TaxID=301880 RepID=A0ABQ5FRZ7_9ASTR